MILIIFNDNFKNYQYLIINLKFSLIKLTLILEGKVLGNSEKQFWESSLNSSASLDIYLRNTKMKNT